MNNQAVAWKEGHNMMYVYWEGALPEETAENVLERIVQNGLGVKFGDEYLLSKNESLIIDDVEIQAFQTLEDWLYSCDGGEYIELTKGLQIGLDDVLNIYVGELYRPVNDGGKSYADLIYEADDPYKTAKDYILTFLKIAIDFKMIDIKVTLRAIQKSIEDGTFEWE